MKKKFQLSTMIATFFGIGYIPFAPGTFGSIMAFPLYFLLSVILIITKGGVSSPASPDLINSILVFTTGLFLIGIWASQEYSRNSGKNDPKEIVIDEVVGQMLTICLVVFMLPYIGHEALIKFEKIGVDKFNLVMWNLFLAFLLFRLFDIVKPWPIKAVERKYKNGLGVMLDDIIAAIFAVIIHFAIMYIIIDQI